MKAYSFKNGNIVIKHNVNGATVFTAIVCNAKDEIVKEVKNLASYGEAKEIAMNGEGV